MSKHCFSFFLSVLILSISSTLIAQQIRFNEASSSNTQYFDEDGDTPDWFELYNTGTGAISLFGWAVTDDISQPDKWTFSDIILESVGYLLIWASGKDRATVGMPRTLISEGDQFRYTTPSGTVSSDWTSVGFNDSGWSQGATGFGYGDADDATMVPTGTRSVFHRKTFNIADVGLIQGLNLHVDEATLPNETSPVYNNPISIGNTTVVKAGFFRPGYIPSRAQSHTYLVNVTHDLPIISLVTEPDNFFDNDFGIYVLSDDYETDFPFIGANFWRL